MNQEEADQDVADARHQVISYTLYSQTDTTCRHTMLEG